MGETRSPTRSPIAGSRTTDVPRADTGAAPGGAALAGSREEQRARRREAARMADLSTVGLVFPVAVVIGYFGGKTVGGWLGSEQGGALAGVLVGVVSGFYNLFKVAMRLQRQDREEDAEARGGLEDETSRGGSRSEEGR
jgi:hypothetical protein